MYSRIRNQPHLPTFPSPKYGGESTAVLREYTKEEYLTMDKDEKRKYHRNMGYRFRKDGDIKSSKWHGKMYGRLERDKDLLPTYYSPEHQKEEESK